MTAAELNTIGRTGVDLNPGNCSGLVKYVARELGYDLPALPANALIDYFNNPAHKWLLVNENDAQFAADHGKLVVAGRKDSPNGHVVVVAPGGKASSGGYIYKDKTGKMQRAANHGLYPRAFSTAMGGWPGGLSRGEKSVFDSWGNAAHYKAVRYWVAPMKTLGFLEFVPGLRIQTKVPIVKHRLWAFPALCQLSTDLKPGTLFIVGGVQLVQKWADLQAVTYVGLKLRVSAQEAAALFDYA